MVMPFTKTSYYQEKISKQQLLQETVREIEFEECEFVDCSFVQCKFEKCSFITCTFQSSMLSAIVPTDSRFVDVRFNKCKVIGFDWTKAHHIQDIHFTDCQLNYSNFRMLKLPKMEMSDCEAKELDFTETHLTEANLCGTDFERSIFLKTILTKANFTGAKNYSIDARNNTIRKAKFSLPEALSLLDCFDVVIE